LSHEVQSGSPCFLNSSERSLGVAGSTPGPTLGQWFMSKGLGLYPLIRFSGCLSESSHRLSLKQFHKDETIGNLFKQQVSQIGIDFDKGTA